MTDRTGRVRVGVDGRVLVDHYHGIGRVTYEVIMRLADDPGIDVVVFTTPDQVSERFDTDALFTRPNVTRHALPAGLPSVRQFLAWPRAVRRAGADVVIFPYHLGVPPWLGVRSLTVLHDCIFETDPSFAPSRKVYTVYSLMTRMVLRRSEVITAARAAGDDIERFYGAHVPDDHIVGWGVSPAFATVGDVSTTDRAPVVPIGQRYLLHVGARRPHKNVPFLVRVLAELDDETHLVLVGSVDERWADETGALAERLGVAGRVHQLASIPEAELLQLYRGAHAFVFPSHTEGFGLPVLEAMAAGTPVVANDIPVLREVGEDAAEFAPVTSTSAWTAAVRRLDDPEHRARLIARGREQSADATWERTGELLARLVRSPARSAPLSRRRRRTETATTSRSRTDRREPSTAP